MIKFSIGMPATILGRIGSANAPAADSRSPGAGFVSIRRTATNRMNPPPTAMPSISVHDAYLLVYGRPATEEVEQWLRAVIGGDAVRSLADLRKIVMALDRQWHPTPLSVRFGASALRTIDIEGFRLVLDEADISVSAPILQTGAWEPHLTGVFRRYLKPGWRVADVGANVGYFTMLAASIVGPAGEVLAFEPNSENARLILLSAEANPFANVRLYPLALSDAMGHAHFSSFIGSNGGFIASEHSELADGRGLVVPTARLDDLVDGRVDFVKLDVEGAEYRVLRGSERLLASSRPIVTCEFSCEMVRRVSRVEPRDFLVFFLASGYTIHLVDRGTGRLVSVGDVDTFLGAWGDAGRIEDLLLLPAASQVLQPE